MASKGYNTWDELFADLKKLNREILDDEVSKMARKTMQTHVQKDVYDKYDPIEYERKRYNGGLIADENIKTDSIKDGIELYNITEHDGKYIPPIIESGKGYSITGKPYGFRYPYEYPRRFQAKTEQDIDEHNLHVKAYEDGLKKRGVEFK